jgi:hypothetical protein
VPHHEKGMLADRQLLQMALRVFTDGRMHGRKEGRKDDGRKRNHNI